jgi:cobalt-zinc-cadmium efflux system outer membrane protein
MRSALVVLLVACAIAGGLPHALADDGQTTSQRSTARNGVWPAQPVVRAASSVRFVERRPAAVTTAAFQSDDQPPALPEPIPSGDSPAPPGITLEELQSIALANNPTLAQAAARVDAARGRWVQVGLYPNPSVGYMADEIGMAGRAGMQGFALSQEIVRGGKLGLERAAASQETAQALQQFESQRLRVLNDVRTQFYNLLVAQRTMELSGELVQLGEQGLKAADDLFRAQEVSRVDLLQARVELSTARVAADVARNRYVAIWRRVAATVGAPDMQPLSPVGDLESAMPELTWDESLARVLAASPEVAAARADVARASWALRRARAEPIPNLHIQASVQHDNEGGDDVAGLQIMFPVPIHNKNQGAIRAAEAELRMARAEVARRELDLQSRLAAAFERYGNARQQVDRYAREILPDARTSLELVTRGYRLGEFAYLPLLEAQRTVSRTNLAYLNALEQLWESATAIEGLLLMDSLQMANR